MAEKIITGCLFGSFNPIHSGHLMVAEYMATRTDLDEVQLIVSPHNPLKERSTLADEKHRLEMARLAVAENGLLNVNAIEFELDRPSYTAVTLDTLAERHPERIFRLIIGSDNLAIFRKWYRWEYILENFGCYVYNRPGSAEEAGFDHDNMRFFRAPLIDVSATYIRESIQDGHSIRYLVPDSVLHYIQQNSVFEPTPE